MAEGGCRLLEGPVLQEPGEEQVTGLEQLEVGLLLVLVMGQKAVRLERQEGRGHDDKLRCAPQVPVRAHVGDEVVGHLGQRQLGNVEPLAGNKAQKQVEGPLELGQRDTESGQPGRRLLLRLRRHRRGR